jgi:hypothetical protein
MTKNQKGLLVVLIAAGLAYLVYTKQFPGKRNQIHYLISGNFSDGTIAELMAMGDDYIKAWYLASKEGKPSFSVGGKNYNIKGGKAI